MSLHEAEESQTTKGTPWKVCLGIRVTPGEADYAFLATVSRVRALRLIAPRHATAAKDT